MSIKYDEYALLELFCNEPKIIDEEAQIFTYSIVDKYGFKFELYFSAYDELVTIRLNYNDLTNPIFDLALSEVQDIQADSEKLTILRNSEKPKVIIYFKPSFILDVDCYC